MGFAATIQVDPAVQQTPSLVRDGNWPQLNLPPMQYAGFANIINAVLNTTFGATPVLGDQYEWPRSRRHAERAVQPRHPRWLDWLPR